MKTAKAQSFRLRIVGLAMIGLCFFSALSAQAQEVIKSGRTCLISLVHEKETAFFVEYFESEYQISLAHNPNIDFFETAEAISNCLESTDYGRVFILTHAKRITNRYASLVSFENQDDASGQAPLRISDLNFALKSNTHPQKLFIASCLSNQVMNNYPRLRKLMNQIEVKFSEEDSTERTNFVSAGRLLKDLLD